MKDTATHFFKPAEPRARSSIDGEDHGGDQGMKGDPVGESCRREEDFMRDRMSGCLSNENF